MAWRQAILWTNAGILFIGPLGTNSSEILIDIDTFSLKNSIENVVCKMVAILSRLQCVKADVLNFILCLYRIYHRHYDDVIMGAIASQITSLTIVYSTVYSGANQSKHQSSASLAFVRGIHRGPVNSPHKGPVTRKMFPFDDVIMKCPQFRCGLFAVDKINNPGRFMSFVYT